MVKIFKYATALVALATISIGLYFYFSFTNIHFDIKNELDIPISAYLTIYSTDTAKEYTYPLLGKEVIPKKATISSFYTVDKSANGTTCMKITFKDDKGEILRSFPCPIEGKSIIVQ